MPDSWPEDMDAMDMDDGYVMEAVATPLMTNVEPSKSLVCGAVHLPKSVSTIVNSVLATSLRD